MSPPPPSPSNFSGYNKVKLFFKKSVLRIIPDLLGLNIIGPIEKVLWGGI